MINWGIIGLGKMANQFATAIKEVKNAKLLAIASKNTEKLKVFGNEYSIKDSYRFNSYDEILSCSDINSIYISF